MNIIIGATMMEIVIFTTLMGFAIVKRIRPKLELQYECANCREVKPTVNFIGAFDNLVSECQECRNLRKRINIVKAMAKNNV